jgi:DNA-binding IclR family transcriptional regulator
LQLLSAFRVRNHAKSLAELASECGLYKSTALRLLNSLAAERFIIRGADGTYRIGPEAARIGALYDEEEDLRKNVLLVLRQLVEATQETAALHVSEGEYRIRRFWVESPLALREHIDGSERLPLNRGAGGLVLSAWKGNKTAAASTIRKQGYAVSRGGRTPELSGISVPVFQHGTELLGALTLTMPSTRYRERWIPLVVAGAEDLTARLGGRKPTVSTAGH